MGITRCVDLSAARWLEQRDEDWRRPAARGPVAFDKYARLRFIPDPSYPAQTEGDAQRDPEGLSDNEQLGVVLAELFHFTGTPDDCYFCIWDGWPSFTADDPTPKIGAASDAIDRLVADSRIDVVVDDPDTEPPYYS
ncbi:hypothetical protein [Rhodococcus koreensis]|uniref:hypothetical protein n=1 Tax=Rhodococcus koreensis TaxID=99653 RepID=UPI00366E3F51